MERHERIPRGVSPLGGEPPASLPASCPDLSLVLACYNEEPVLVQSVEEIVTALDGSRLAYELILVDDASRDRTPELIERLVEKYRGSVPINALFHARNVGRGGTVRDGLRTARGEVAGFIDVDLEVHARYIMPCVLAVREGADVVVAKRISQFQWRSLDRHLLSRGYAWLVRRLFRLPVSDTEAGFKFFRRASLLPVLERSREAGWFWDTEILVLARAAGLTMAEIPCRYVRRFDKPSSVRPVRDTLHYLMRLWRFRKARRARRERAPQRDGLPPARPGA